MRHGGWTDFGLRDHLVLIWWPVMYGSLFYGVLLIPLASLSRYAVWTIYARRTVGEAGS